MSGYRKAGPVTLALGLILAGCILLISNIKGYGIIGAALKFWPVLLIGLGAEYFIRSYLNKKKHGDEAETKFSLATVVVILLVALFGYVGQQAAGVFENQELKTIITEAIAGDRYSYKNEFRSKAIDVKPGITSIKLDGLNGRVDLVPSTDGKFHVEAGITGWGASESEARRKAEMYKIDIKEGDVINVYTGQQATNSRRPLEVTYRFMIPKGVNVVVDSEGVIKADNIEANIKVKALNGEVTLRNIKGDISFEGDNGQATFENIDGNLESRLGSGKLYIKDVAKNIHVDNDNCNVEIVSSKPVGMNYAVNSLNGFIVLKVPEASNAAVKAETAAGKIRGSLVEPGKLTQPDQLAQPNQSGQPGQSRDQGPGGKASIVLGSGKGLINLTSETGNIVLDKY